MNYRNASQVRHAHMNVPAITNDRVAVIVTTKLSARKSIMGVQFWTREMIEAKTSTNSDRTVSTFIEHLHPSTAPAKFEGMVDVGGEQFAHFSNVALD